MNTGEEEAFGSSVVAVVGAGGGAVAVAAGGGAVAEGAEPLSESEVCVGVGKLSVALRELNSTSACAESVALTETVVTVVT